MGIHGYTRVYIGILGYGCNGMLGYTIVILGYTMGILGYTRVY